MRKNHRHFIEVSKGNWTRVNRSILFREIDSNIQITLQFPLISEEFRLLKSELNVFSKRGEATPSPLYYDRLFCVACLR